MAGRGPAPKPAEKRARKNLESQPLAVVEIQPVPSVPDLPSTFLVASRDGTVEMPYPEATRGWWQNWVKSPFSRDYDALVWDRLRMAANLHARAEYGDLKAFNEFRLWMALFPETPADRLRQRIQVAQAVDAEVSATSKVVTAQRRFSRGEITRELG